VKKRIANRDGGEIARWLTGFTTATARYSLFFDSASIHLSLLLSYSDCLVFLFVGFVVLMVYDGCCDLQEVKFGGA
jgi:hypothetical protein